MKYFALFTLLSIAACAGIGSDSEFLSGRRALLRGEPDNALVSFERVAQTNPGFVPDMVSPRRSIWTYVGRAHYNAGRYTEARSAFEKAVSQMNDDYLARL
jgi:tetratricopeptide (TPR) repeat protein